ncbi:hypothetical protein HPO96_03745 [Kribbella sandramycini]|uniref:Uncharacterized protein n=1 Tax=Kribbella sandramycini TaxID=60450 RepID=A0A7Y4KVD2_9ACTN|nr:hypothetical protein [Kribbella sandramycini]MBB6568054.1 hypothetical protein [Kribbella sandramycini]NOL39352.1 hypothetical protein [Kribbella sandramycini]
MNEMDDGEEYWLEGGVEVVASGAQNGFLPEVDRVIDLLGTNRSWLAWWRETSKAPVLEVHIMVVKAGSMGLAEERVVRGRKRHLVDMFVDFAQLDVLEPDERRLLALPVVLEGIARAQSALKLSADRPELPDDVRPAPLSPGALRRRRLRDLRGLPNAALPEGPFQGMTETPKVIQIPLPSPDRRAPIPYLVENDPAGDQVVVEIHVPFGAPGADDAWIDEIQDFLDDESSDGSFDIYDLAGGDGDAYVYYLTGAPTEALLRTAAEVAALPGVPTGVFTVIIDEA